jgi:hypothetical protein
VWHAEPLVDTNGLPALGDSLQAAGLGWVAGGPAPFGPGSVPSSSARVIHLVNQSTAVGAGNFAAAVAARQRQVGKSITTEGNGCK